MGNHHHHPSNTKNPSTFTDHDSILTHLLDSYKKILFDHFEIADVIMVQSLLFMVLMGGCARGVRFTDSTICKPRTTYRYKPLCNDRESARHDSLLPNNILPDRSTLLASLQQTQSQHWYPDSRRHQTQMNASSSFRVSQYCAMMACTVHISQMLTSSTNGDTKRFVNAVGHLERCMRVFDNLRGVFITAERCWKTVLDFLTAKGNQVG
ncbi:hypothetical protein BDR26DRAFT_41642 [Obelidium mucronatum]|nr:hypothetical protein BDR26DRAFT_41642 [Obelidium mucronatum]